MRRERETNREKLGERDMQKRERQREIVVEEDRDGKKGTDREIDY